MARRITGHGYQRGVGAVSADILWVPCLKMDSHDPPYADRMIRLFLLSHQERGHVLFQTETPRPAPSCSAIMPIPGCTWHITPGTVPDLATLNAFDGFIEMTAPSDDIPFDLVDQLWPGPKLTRFILIRPAHHRLANLVNSIEKMRSRFPGLGLWIDQPTVGWDALAYLLAVFPGLHPVRIQDDELDRLLNIGQKLEREVFLADFSGLPPIKIPFLPRYAPDPARHWRRVPINPRFV